MDERTNPQLFSRHRLIIGLIVLAVILGGLKLRSWTWEETTHLRFQHDIVNGFYWGRETLKEARRQSPDETSANTMAGFFRGYYALYDRVRAEAWEKNYLLDYPPLRLLVMSLWTRHVRQEFPGLEDGTPDYVQPLLRLNVFCEALSAGAIFLLVRLWVRRAAGNTHSRWVRHVPQEQRASFCGLAAASAAWLDPSLILDAHGWPQWDVWILPFYLFAALAASKNRWFWCGCLLAGGAMLKGQLLLVAPFFVFWPLSQKRWRRAVDLLAGFVATISLIISPWMLRTPGAWLVLAGAALGAGVLFLRKPSPRGRYWFMGTLGVATLTAGALCGGTFAWLQIGLLYGSERYPYLFISSCYNLPSLLADLGWGLKNALFVVHLGSLQVSVTPQWTLRLIYILALAFCAAGAARHARKRDPRVLIAIAAPWLVMFALLGQMHERYLMWGGVVSAVALGVSVRLALLNFLISAASMAMILHVMLLDKKLEATLGIITLLDRIRPAASWINLALIAIWFWESVSTKIPAFRGRRQATFPGILRYGKKLTQNQSG